MLLRRSRLLLEVSPAVRGLACCGDQRRVDERILSSRCVAPNVSCARVLYTRSLIVAELEAGRVHEHDDFLFVRFWCAPFPRHLKHICPEIFLDTFYLARYAWHEAALEKAAKQG